MNTVRCYVSSISCCLCMVHGYAVQTELSISSESIAQTLARQVGTVAEQSQPHDDEVSVSVTSNMPDLAKVNSSSETHIGGIAELEQKIDECEHQMRDMLRTLVAIKKRMRVLRRIIDERLVDCQRQIAQLKDHINHEVPTHPLTVTSTCDHLALGGTI